MSSQCPLYLWLGIDAGEQNHDFVLLDAKGKLVKRAKCANRRTKIRDLLSRWKATYPEAKIRIVTEAFRGVGALLHRTALPLGLEVWKVPPSALCSFRKSEGQPRKSDPRDAFLLARMGFLEMSTCRPQIQPRDDEARLCRLERLAEQLTGQLTQLWHRLRSRLLELHPALVDRSHPTPHHHSLRMLNILLEFPGLVGVETTSLKKLEKLLSSVSPAQRKEEAQQLQDLVKKLEIPEELRAMFSLELDILARQIYDLRQHKARVKKLLEKAVVDHPVGKRLLRVPGVGPHVAAVLLAEVLPLARHATEPQVATYSGLTPLCRRSGRSQGRDRLSRGTNKRVMRALYLSATAARRHSALDRAYYARQVDRHVGHPVPYIVATLSLARQRMKMLYRLMTTEMEYDKEVLIRSHLQRRSIAA